VGASGHLVLQQNRPFVLKWYCRAAPKAALGQLRCSQLPSAGAHRWACSLGTLSTVWGQHNHLHLEDDLSVRLKTTPA
jgi:hypothetical protein